METPKEVIQAAGGLIEMYGDCLEYLGERKGQDVFQFAIPPKYFTGYPFLFLYKDGAVRKVIGLDALNIVLEFAE